MKLGLAFNLVPESDGIGVGPTDRFQEYDDLETIDHVAGAIERLGHEVVHLGAGREFVTAMLTGPCDLVFNLAEGAGGRSREAHVPAVCEMLAIPHTHSDALTLAATLDKSVAKAVVAAAGINTPTYAVLEDPEEAAGVELRYPVIAKPLAEGSRMGLRASSCVDDASALRAEAARLLEDYSQPVLVEEFCPGAELTVAVLGTGGSAEALGVMEIAPSPDTSLDRWINTYAGKKAGPPAVNYLVPPDRPAELIEQALALGVGAHRALRCFDVSRVDVRVDADGKLSFLESNPLPGLHEGFSDLTFLAAGYGISFDEVVARIVGAARDRLGI